MKSNNIFFYLHLNLILLLPLLDVEEKEVFGAFLKVEEEGLTVRVILLEEG